MKAFIDVRNISQRKKLHGKPFRVYPAFIRFIYIPWIPWKSNGELALSRTWNIIHAQCEFERAEIIQLSHRQFVSFECLEHLCRQSNRMHESRQHFPEATSSTANLRLHFVMSSFKNEDCLKIEINWYQSSTHKFRAIQLIIRSRYPFVYESNQPVQESHTKSFHYWIPSCPNKSVKSCHNQMIIIRLHEYFMVIGNCALVLREGGDDRTFFRKKNKLCDINWLMAGWSRIGNIIKLI